MNISKQQMQTIIDTAPPDVDIEELQISFLKDGYTIEGIDTKQALDYYNQKTGVVAPQNIQNIQDMTGMSKSPFQATGDENLISGASKAIGNLPRSAFELGKNVAQAVLNPIDTAKSVGSIVKGAGGKLAETAIENTDIGQALLRKINESRIARNIEPLKTDENGMLQGEKTEDMQAVEQVGKFFSDRYGNLDKFKETAIEDPAGVLADLATVISGGAGVASKVGQISKVGEISNIGTQLSKVSQAIEPINAITKTAKGVKNIAGKTTAGKIVSDIIPTSSDVQRSQVVKALDLTQGDLATIGKKTGNDVTDFIVSKGLIRESPELVAQSLNDLRKTTKKLKGEEVSKVKSTYTLDKVPKVQQGLNTILDGVDNVAGLEDVTNKIKTLLKKDTFTLEDIQNAQYLIDENSNIYSKIGDVKSSSTARGLDKIRKDIKTFIEDEVTKATNGQTSIKQLNNDIQTSFAIEDAINTRATRNLTRQKISLSDSIVLFGGSATFDPLVGVGLYIGKKIIETPTARLAFVKLLNAQPSSTIKRIVSQIKNKTVSPETQKLLNQIAEKASKNKSTLESGSVILNKTKEEKKQ